MVEVRHTADPGDRTDGDDEQPRGCRGPVKYKMNGRWTSLADRQPSSANDGTHIGQSVAYRNTHRSMGRRTDGRSRGGIL